QARVRPGDADPGTADHARARQAGAGRRAHHRADRRHLDPVDPHQGRPRGEGVTPDAVIGAGALWIAIPLALLAGLVSFLSPCILPLVPGYLGFLGGAAGTAAPSAQVSASTSPRRRMLLSVLLFIAGFTVVFVAYTVIGGA